MKAVRTTLQNALAIVGVSAPEKCNEEKRKRTFVLNKRQSHDVVIAFYVEIIKNLSNKREFASSYINDRRLMMEEKIEELIDIYKQQIYSLCYKLAKTKEDAEDIFQETWIKVFSSRHQLSYVENYKNGLLQFVFVRFMILS